MVVQDRVSIRRGCVSVCGFLFLLQACVPPSAELQSARTLGVGGIEITPGYTFTTDAEQHDLSLRGGVGVHERVDVRAQYVFSTASIDFGYGLSEDNVQGHSLALGPKIGVVHDYFSVALPIGFGFGEDIDMSSSWVIAPTLLGSLKLSEIFEVNPSVKFILFFEDDAFIAVNLGLAVGTDLARFAVRPEFGILASVEGGDPVYLLGIGTSFGIPAE